MGRPRTSRQRSVARALTALLPLAPYSDTEAIRAIALEAKFRDLPASIAVWLATVAHVRHEHTEYDTLLAEGYDREAARHFTLAQVNDRLTTWRATRLLAEDDEDVGDE
jgi:hypothetical protein